MKPATARKRKSVSFNDVEDVINLEDIDPNVGKFRNLVQSSIVAIHPSKKARTESSFSSLSFLPRIDPAPQTVATIHNNVNMNQQHPHSLSSSSSTSSSHFIKSLGITLPNPAPELNNSNNSSNSIDLNNPDMLNNFGVIRCPTLYDDLMPICSDPSDSSLDPSSSKKKYAKEAWPGHHHSGHNSATLANF